jgi:hypothetical protein
LTTYPLFRKFSSRNGRLKALHLSQFVKLLAYHFRRSSRWFRLIHEAACGRFDVAHLHACRKSLPGSLPLEIRRHKVPYVLSRTAPGRSSNGGEPSTGLDPRGRRLPNGATRVSP